MKRKGVCLLLVFCTSVKAHAMEGFWGQVVEHSKLGREMTTTDTKRIVAVSAHNLYAYQEGSHSENLRVMIAHVHSAIADDVDLIELDLLSYRDFFQQKHTEIAHDYRARLNRAVGLEEVLADEKLK